MEQWNAAVGLGYTVIAYFGSLRGSEGLKVDYNTLVKHWDKGRVTKPKSKIPPRIIVPILGCFKGEHGERCHLMPLANITNSGVHIRNIYN